MFAQGRRLSCLLLAAALLLTAARLPGCGAGGAYARRGDASSTLYIGEVASSFPTSYMPWFSRDGIAPTISSMVYSPLFSYDENTGEYVPRLAVSWCYVDKEGEPIVTSSGQPDYDRLEEVYGGNDSAFFPVRFELNPDAVWSDGTPVTVRDIYFTFDLAANQKLSNHAGALAWVNDLLHKYDTNTGLMKRQGIYTYDTGAAEAGYAISEEERDTVFYFEVSKVLGAIAPLVSTVLILPEHIYAPIISLDNPLNSTSPDEALSYAYLHPIGCGPYTLDAEQSNAQEIVLRRRDDYHIKAADGGALYQADTLRFILYQEINVAIYALKKGHLDVLDSAISANYAALFEDDENIQLLKAPGLFAQALVLNLNAPADQATPRRTILSDIRVREAIALAVDQEELIRNVLSGEGRPVSAGLVLDTMPDLYNPEADILSGDMTDRLVRANAILDECYPRRDKEGYRCTEDGLRLSFEVLGSPGEQEAIGFLQVLLQKIGVEVRFAAKGNSPESTYLYGGNFDMTIQGVSFSLYNADIMFNSHFSNLNRSSNYGRLQDQAINDKIDEMRLTINLNKKYQAIRDVQLLTAAQYYKIPLYCSNVLSVARTDRFAGWAQVDGSTAFSLESLEHLKMV